MNNNIIQILNDIKNKIDIIEKKVDKIDIIEKKVDKIDIIEKKMDIIEKEVKIIKNNIKTINNHIKKESLYNEYRITNKLLSHLKNTEISYVYYIPSINDFPRNIFINKKSITDIDGVIIGTNDINKTKNTLDINGKINNQLFKSSINGKINNRYNSFTFTNNYLEYKSKDKNNSNNNNNKSINFTNKLSEYNLHIIESKHTLSINKVYTKFNQVKSIIERIEEKNDKLEYMNKFLNNIYLYFAAPNIEERIYKYIQDNHINEFDIIKMKNNNNFKYIIKVKLISTNTETISPIYYNILLK